MPNQVDARSRLRAGQILIGAMLVSLVGFSVVAWVLSPVGDQPEAERILLWVAIGYAIANVPLYIFVAPMMTQSALRRGQDDLAQSSATERRVGALVTLAIIRGAMAEGAGLLGAVVLLLTANQLCWIAVAVGALLLLAALPTEDKLFAMDG